MAHSSSPRVHTSRRVVLIIMLLVVVSSIVFPVIDAEAQDDTPTAVSPELFSAAPYTVGERLTYNVSFATFPSAAYIELTVARRTTVANRDAIELRAHVETLGVVNAALYAANDDYRTFVDPRTGVPFRTQIETRDGARAEDLGSDRNQIAGAAPTPKRNAQLVVPGTYDLLGAVYRARALPLAVGATYRFQIAAGRSVSEIYDVELRVTGRELTKTSVGSYNTLVATARARGSVTYPTRIHFTDDERRVPVFASIQHPAGEIRAELVSSTIVAPAAATPTPDVAARPPANGVMPPAPVAPFTPPATRPASSAASTAATPKVGEQLNFNVLLGSPPQIVGTISFDVRGRGSYFDREGLLVVATARTSGVGQQLFPVSNNYTTYIDPASLLPFRSEMRLSEGARRFNRTLAFDQNAGRVTREDGLATEIPSGTYDFASLVYALRGFDITPPRRTSLAIFTGNRAHTLTLTAVAREQIELGGERLPAIQLVLTTDDREPDRNAYRLWISDDSRRLPLRFTATTPLGPVRADLAIIPVVTQ